MAEGQVSDICVFHVSMRTIIITKTNTNNENETTTFFNAYPALLHGDMGATI